jgi:hypothetical protein
MCIVLSANLELGLPHKVFHTRFSYWKYFIEFLLPSCIGLEKPPDIVSEEILVSFIFCSNKAFPIIWMPFISLREFHTMNVALLHNQSHYWVKLKSSVSFWPEIWYLQVATDRLWFIWVSTWTFILQYNRQPKLMCFNTFKGCFFNKRNKPNKQN